MNLITIKTFNFVHESAVIQSILESEEIHCFVKDELTAQIHPFHSQAIGGIKLQVMEQDLEKAVGILRNAGYLQEEDLYPTPFQVKLYKFLSRIPGIRNIYKD